MYTDHPVGFVVFRATYLWFLFRWMDTGSIPIQVTPLFQLKSQRKLLAECHEVTESFLSLDFQQYIVWMYYDFFMYFPVAYHSNYFLLID